MKLRTKNMHTYSVNFSKRENYEILVQNNGDDVFRVSRVFQLGGRITADIHLENNFILDVSYLFYNLEIVDSKLDDLILIYNFNPLFTKILIGENEIKSKSQVPIFCKYYSKIYYNGGLVAIVKNQTPISFGDIIMKIEFLIDDKKVEHESILCFILREISLNI